VKYDKNYTAQFTRRNNNFPFSILKKEIEFEKGKSTVAAGYKEITPLYATSFKPKFCPPSIRTQLAL